MNTYETQIKDWLSEHGSPTLSQWLNRNPDIKTWVIDQTSQYTVKNIMERVYIIFNGPQPICSQGNPLQFNTLEKGYRKGCILGNKCKCVGEHRMAGQKRTLLQKYNVDTVGNIPGVQDKIKNTNIKKYGATHHMKTPEYKQLYSEILNNKSDEEKAAKSEKYRETSLARYGVVHHMKLVEQQSKVTATNQERYGVNSPLQHPDFLNKSKITWENKSEEELIAIDIKRRETMLANYGVAYGSQIECGPDAISILKNPERFSEIIQNKTRDEARKALNTSLSCLNAYAKQYDMRSLLKSEHGTSKPERAIADYIKTLGVTVIQNTYDIIPPKEVDVYIPDHKIAIEYCGLYYHSDLFNTDPLYHYNKYNDCYNRGIRLITIFGDVWKHKESMVKYRLKNIISQYNDVFNINDYTVQSINCGLAKDFIDSHHIQNYIHCDINIASIDINGHISAVISFNRKNSKQFELVQYCAVSEKLIKPMFLFFIDHEAPQLILHHGNNEWGFDTVLPILDFTVLTSGIDYSYTNFVYRYDHGGDTAYKIWGCGQATWQWINTKTH